MCAKTTDKHGEQDIISECYSFDEPIAWSYCETTTKGGDPSHILYYFHGRGGDEKTWIAICRPIRDQWKRNGVKAPVVISITFGERWLLAPKNASPQSGLLDFFLNVAIPTIEKKRNKRIHTRSVMGVSMGGYSAAQVLFRKPELFDRGALVHPAITPVSPYASEHDIDQFEEITRKRNKNITYIIKSFLTNMDPAKKNIQVIFATSKLFFPDNVSWSEASPLRLIDTVKKKKNRKLFISCGLNDEYGLYEGSKLLAEKAIKNGLDVQWRPIPGGHGAIDYTAIANFLAD